VKVAEIKLGRWQSRSEADRKGYNLACWLLDRQRGVARRGPLALFAAHQLISLEGKLARMEDSVQEALDPWTEAAHDDPERFEYEELFPQGTLWGWLHEAVPSNKLPQALDVLELRSARQWAAQRLERHGKKLLAKHGDLVVESMVLGDWVHQPLYSTLDFGTASHFSAESAERRAQRQVEHLSNDAQLARDTVLDHAAIYFACTTELVRRKLELLQLKASLRGIALFTKVLFG
jgi:hypothetical protein